MFDGEISEMLINGQLELYGHSHPAEFFPRPSDDDIETLQKLGQKKSRLISAVTGKEMEFVGHKFRMMDSAEEIEGSEVGNVDI